MTHITSSQRTQITHRAIAFGFPKDIAFRISMNLTNSSPEELMCLTQPSDFLSCSFSWGNSPEGHKFWEKIYFQVIERESFAAAIPKVKRDLTQGETQQLLHILRRDLRHTTDRKESYQSAASELWKGANKDEEEGQNYFEEFSFCNALAKKAKQEEKTLVNLITKLKGLR